MGIKMLVYSSERNTFLNNSALKLKLFTKKDLFETSFKEGENDYKRLNVNLNCTIMIVVVQSNDPIYDAECSNDDWQ